MDNSVAFQVGEVIGAVLMLAILVGGLAFFVFAFIRAIRTGRKGWIIAACVSGLPVLAFVVLFFIGMVVGVMRAADRSGPLFGASHSTAELLTTNMTSVPGSVIAYGISYPSFDAWKKHDTANGAFDLLYSFHDQYVGVIAESIGVGTSQNVCDLSQDHLASTASRHTFTTPQPIQIDSRQWLMYDATATVSGIDIKYRIYVYADSSNTFQILSWASPGNFASCSPLFDRVATSFRFPK